MMATEKIKQNPRDKAVDNLIEKLENNPGIWQKTWQTLVTNRPYNPISGTNYRGVNLLNLALTAQAKFDGDPRWATYNQAKEAGYPVKLGSKSEATAVFHKITPQLQLPNGESIPIKASTVAGQVKEIKEVVQKHMPNFGTSIQSIDNLAALSKKLNIEGSFKVWNKAIATSAPLFNFAQLENAPAIEIKEAKKQWQDYERAENLLQATNYKINHDQLTRNFYRSSTKEIHLTSKASFKSPEDYYATAFHECSHAKLDDGTIPLNYDKTKYEINKSVRAKEELRAEISSVLICAELGMNYDIQNHASYVNSWIQILKDDKAELWSAVSDSNKVADGIISFEKQMELENENKQLPPEDELKSEQEPQNQLATALNHISHEDVLGDPGLDGDDIEKEKEMTLF